MKTFYIIFIAFAIISCESIANKSENLNEAEFPIAGTWYVNDNGEAYSDNALNFAEYTFGEPTKAGDRYIGRVNAIHFQDSNYTHTGDYEVVGENKLKISFPNEMDYEFTYTYYPDEQKLEIDFAGQQRTLTRKQAILETEEEKQAQLWMEKIEGKWQYIVIAKNEVCTFSKPTMEGNSIKGKFEQKNERGTTTFEYEKFSNGLCRMKNLDDPYVLEHDRNILELNDVGDTLTLNGIVMIRIN